jgi:gliding motility-associated-like protein
MPLINTSEIAVFDFNNFTGEFSNGFKVRLPENILLEDAEISPDGFKLYVGAKEVTPRGEAETVVHKVYQMDLMAGDVDAIEKSFYSLTTVGDRSGCGPKICYFINRTMQLAPDGKIYVSMREVVGARPINLDVTASLIEEPNELKGNARYRKNAAKIRRKYIYILYNYVRSSTFTIKENGIQFKKRVCADQPVDFSLLLSNVDSVKWDFGDSPSGYDNYSTSFTPQHTYPGTGNYSVKAIIYNRCFTDTAYATVTIEPDKAVKIPGNIKDSIVCVGEQLFMDATTPYATEYAWGGGNQKPVQEITVTGRYEIKALNNCSIDVRIFNVTFQPCNCDVFVPTAFTPNNDGLNDKFKPIVKCFAKDYRFQIFNRWGYLVYTSTSYDNGWDGNIKNIPANNGTYIWMVQYRDPSTKQFYKKNGTVVLIR